MVHNLVLKTNQNRNVTLLKKFKLDIFFLSKNEEKYFYYISSRTLYLLYVLFCSTNNIKDLNIWYL